MRKPAKWRHRMKKCFSDLPKFSFFMKKWYVLAMKITFLCNLVIMAMVYKAVYSHGCRILLCSETMAKMGYNIALFLYIRMSYFNNFFIRIRYLSLLFHRFNSLLGILNIIEQFWIFMNILWPLTSGHVNCISK